MQPIVFYILSGPDIWVNSFTKGPIPLILRDSPPEVREYDRRFNHIQAVLIYTLTLFLILFRYPLNIRTRWDCISS